MSMMLSVMLSSLVQTAKCSTCLLNHEKKFLGLLLPSFYWDSLQSPLLLKSINGVDNTNSVRDIFPGRFTRPRNFDHLARQQSEVTRHGILNADFRELIRIDFVPDVHKHNSHENMVKIGLCWSNCTIITVDQAWLQILSAISIRRTLLTSRISLPVSVRGGVVRVYAGWCPLTNHACWIVTDKVWDIHDTTEIWEQEKTNGLSEMLHECCDWGRCWWGRSAAWWS